MDMFVIYNPHYPQLRTALLDAAYGQQRDGLKESCQVEFHKGFPQILIAFLPCLLRDSLLMCQFPFCWPFMR